MPPSGNTTRSTLLHATVTSPNAYSTQRAYPNVPRFTQCVMVAHALRVPVERMVHQGRRARRGGRRSPGPTGDEGGRGQCHGDRLRGRPGRGPARDEGGPVHPPPPP